MRVVFNFRGTGAGNNGGTRTLFKSAIQLSEMGVEAEIWSDSPNQFTWFSLPDNVPFIQSRGAPEKEADVIIASGSGSVRDTLEQGAQAWYWVRAIETWTKTEVDLIRDYRSGVKLMANATWMVDWIRERAGVEAHLIMPGVETEFFYPGKRQQGGVITVGALYSPKPRKRPGDIEKVFKTLKDRYGKGIRTVLLTTDLVPGNIVCDDVITRPTEDEKREMYQGTDIWFAPTDGEGLHVPPLEAGACGCALVAHGVSEAGMGDYARHEETALCYERYNVKQAVEMIDLLIGNTEKRSSISGALRKWIVENIGNREANMKKMLDLFNEESS